MKPVLRDICRALGLQHVADLQKKGLHMPGEYLAQNKDQLLVRVRDSLNYLNKSSAIEDNKFAQNYFQICWFKYERFVGDHSFRRVVAKL